MSTIAEPREATTRGADSGSPDVVSRSARSKPVDPPRIGPLPEPSLVERLRRSWSVYALLPAVDHEGGRSWKRAAWAAVALHLVAFVGIVVVSRLAHARTDDGGPDIATMLNTGDIKEEAPPDKPKPADGSDGGPADGPRDPGSSSNGGASNTGTKPLTAGQLPPPSATPPIPAVVMPPTSAPLVVPPSVDSPSVDIPPPTNPGLPTGAPPDGPPSPGNKGGSEIGDGTGTRIGTGTGSDPAGGNGNPGSGGGGDTTRPAAAPGGPDQGSGLYKGPPFGAKDHDIKFIVKSRPVISQAMIDAGTFGTVRVSITVGADGRILSAAAMDRLANGGTQAAMDALYRCRFEPAVRGGKYVTSSTVIRFDITERGT